MIKLQDCLLPFCVGVYPFDACTNVGEFHDKEEIWDWVTGLIPSVNGPCIVADSYYLTRAAVSKLVNADVHFLCALKPNNFKEYVKMLGRDVGAMGQTSVIENRDEGLVAVHHWDPDDKIGKKYVLSNSFVVSSSARPEIGHHMVYWAYKRRFSYCDEFNKSLFGFKYPFRRDSWAKNFDSLFFSVLLVNCYHMWVYASVENEGKLSLVEFTRQLGLELMRK